MVACVIQAVTGRIKAKQLDTLRLACRSAEVTTFRRVGFALDVDYEWNYSAGICGGCCCYRGGGDFYAWPVLYIVPIVGHNQPEDSSHSNHTDLDTTHGDNLMHQQKGYVRIQHCNDGNLWTPVPSSLELEAALNRTAAHMFGNHNDSTDSAARSVWKTFASKLVSNRHAYLYQHRSLVVLALILWTWLAIVEPWLLVQSYESLDDDWYRVYPVWLGFVLLLGLAWRKSDLQDQTYALVRQCALDLERLGQRKDDHTGDVSSSSSNSNWHVEQRRIAEVSDCCSSCCAEYGLSVLCRVHYIYLFPPTTTTQAIQYNPQPPSAIATVAVAENLV